MNNILVIGSTGQIGSELTRKLRGIYGNANVVAGYIKGAEPKGELAEAGPMAECDVTNPQMIADVVKKYNIDAIYNLAALLSVVAESKPRLAWKIGIDGLWNILEVAREHGCAVFTPSSIGSFGLSTPKMLTPQDTIQRPRTIYGISKVTTELLSDYYHNKYGVDTRAVRFPGVISYVTPPGGGTTDYAVDIYYSAVRGEKFGFSVFRCRTNFERGHYEDFLRAIWIRPGFCQHSRQGRQCPALRLGADGAIRRADDRQREKRHRPWLPRQGLRLPLYLLRPLAGLRESAPRQRHLP